MAGGLSPGETSPGSRSLRPAPPLLRARLTVRRKNSTGEKQHVAGAAVLLGTYRRNLGPTAHLRRLSPLLSARVSPVPRRAPRFFSSLSPRWLNHRLGPERRCSPDDNNPRVLLSPPAVHREREREREVGRLRESRGETTQVSPLSDAASEALPPERRPPAGEREGGRARLPLGGFTIRAREEPVAFSARIHCVDTKLACRYIIYIII